MPSLEAHMNVLFSRKSQKEALEVAALYENPRNFVLVFNESDLNDNSAGNLVAKIKILADAGYIRWSYEEYSDVDEKEKQYKVKNMGLTAEGEKYLNSFSMFSNYRPIMQAGIGAFIATVLCKIFGII